MLGLCDLWDNELDCLFPDLILDGLNWNGDRFEGLLDGLICALVFEVLEGKEDCLGGKEDCLGGEGLGRNDCLGAGEGTNPDGCL